MIPTSHKQLDQAHLDALRDVLVDATKLFTPTVRSLILGQVNASMAHLSERLDLLQARESLDPPSQEKTDAPASP